ncbi:MAG: hypothetical protein DRO93_09350 [Candidatus Thorarchaeota archaeon]|nr:MAG: hypothetical protein DRO93_09350 [Candidatus Thorarchaeota archaeon]
MSLLSGISSLDSVMGGGLREGAFTHVYGEAASGKSTLGLVFVRAALLTGIGTIILNPETSSPIERLEQIVGKPFEEVADSVRIIVPKTFEEQGHIIEDLELYLRDNTRLIMVDTLTKLYRVSLEDRERNYEAHRELNRQAGILKGIVKLRGLFLLVLNQVRGRIATGQHDFEPVAASIMDYWSDCTIRMDIGHTPSERIITRIEDGTVSRTCRLFLSRTGFVTEPAASERKK